MPYIGTRKLHYLLSSVLQEHDISIGRDQLFDLLSANQLLIRRRKRRKAITTNSDHPFRKYPNLVKGLSIKEPNRLWVSDITYISLRSQFAYLSLVTDAYSKKIVGYCLYPTLQKEGSMKALFKALETITQPLETTLIHHSDRGLQYCCSEYIKVLTENGIIISMTEKGDPYENAIAERVNGILKHEFGLNKCFDDYETAVEAVAKSVEVYNTIRPHSSCNYMTPSLAHQCNGELKLKWKRREVMK